VNPASYYKNAQTKLIFIATKWQKKQKRLSKLENIAERFKYKKNKQIESLFTQQSYIFYAGTFCN
jgi:hypothetical protein